MATISEIGERNLIELFTKHITFLPGMPVPHWDDVNAVSLGDGKAAILKTDMLVWKTDVPAGMTPFQVGRKAVVMNFSDLGAKGVKPQAFLASLAAPSTTKTSVIEDIVRGFNSGAREYDGYMVGGDTNEACDIIISGMAYGLANINQLMLRGTSNPGDILATTGGFGHTTAGFKILLDGFSSPDDLKAMLLDSIYNPKARVREGLALAESGVVTSSIDSSDGLAICLHDLQRSSGHGFVLDKVPLREEAERFAELHDLDKYSLGLYGGEEYELVFTVKPGCIDEAKQALDRVGSDLIEIGRVTKSKDIVYYVNNVKKPVGSGGWEHFKGLK
jgi:thiamine-monophosphate kinase